MELDTVGALDARDTLDAVAAFLLVAELPVVGEAVALALDELTFWVALDDDEDEELRVALLDEDPLFRLTDELVDELDDELDDEVEDELDEEEPDDGLLLFDVDELCDFLETDVEPLAPDDPEDLVFFADFSWLMPVPPPLACTSTGTASTSDKATKPDKMMSLAVLIIIMLNLSFRCLDFKIKVAS